MKNSTPCEIVTHKNVTLHLLMEKPHQKRAWVLMSRT